MLMSKIFDRFVEKTPASVMARAAMEHVMAPEALDALFVKHANEIAFLRRRRDARGARGATAGVKTLVERTRPGGTSG